ARDARRARPRRRFARPASHWRRRMTSWRSRKSGVAMVLVAAVSARGGVPAAHAADRRESESGSDGGRQRQTATPIKHVIIIVGENRSFDHLYATYVPKRKEEKVLNLLSEGIV